MSISRKITEGGSGGGSAGEDKFSTYLYTGNGGGQNLAKGIDLGGEGGMVWIKNRTQSSSAPHLLTDTEMSKGASGFYPSLASNSNSPLNPMVQGHIYDFNGNGFKLQGNYDFNNKPGQDYVSWTFRKAPKFFDVVTYTGDNDNSRTIPHNLGAEPGMIIIKRMNAAEDWSVYHRSTGAGKFLKLNTSSSELNGPSDYRAVPTDTEFFLGNDLRVNATNSDEYVAYLFAHDDSEEGMIQCGSYTGNQTAGKEVDLGFEPQFVLIKAASGTGEWYMFDTMRGIVTGGFDPFLRADMSAVESASSEQLEVNPTGFSLSADINVNKNNVEYIFMAIRRPNKPAEEFEPEELFHVELNNFGEVTPGNNFPVDMFIHTEYAATQYRRIIPRLLGNKHVLLTEDQTAEYEESYWAFDDNTGVRGTYSPTSTGNQWVYNLWRRAPGFFDVVAYEGDGQAGREVPHSLGAVPEMMWVKRRDAADDWYVYHRNVHPDPTGYKLYLNTDGARRSSSGIWGVSGQESTASEFTVAGAINNLSGEFVAYLFASVPSICDIGSYTGTGSAQEIDCGFTNGSRFVLIKRTDINGDWMYFDTARGISDSDSPLLALNKTDAQVSGSYIKPNPKGFTATGNLTGVDGAEYIYYAIA